MKISSVSFTSLDVTPIDVNLWKLNKILKIWVNFEDGRSTKFEINEGFVTNFRSGTDLINPIIPRSGNEFMTICYILHDALYTQEHQVTKQFADDLLDAMLENEGTLGSFRRWLIIKALKAFGGPAWNEQNTGWYKNNGKKLFINKYT